MKNAYLEDHVGAGSGWETKGIEAGAMAGKAVGRSGLDRKRRWNRDIRNGGDAK